MYRPAGKMILLLATDHMTIRRSIGGQKPLEVPQLPFAQHPQIGAGKWEQRLNPSSDLRFKLGSTPSHDTTSFRLVLFLHHLVESLADDLALANSWLRGFSTEYLSSEPLVVFLCYKNTLWNQFHRGTSYYRPQ